MECAAQPLLPETRLSKRFTDPILAVRWRHQFNPQWSTLLYADAGGFGVGSHATWQVLATVNYQVREQLYLSLGYRQLNVDTTARMHSAWTCAWAAPSSA